jgi:antitoxin CptB
MSAFYQLNSVNRACLRWRARRGLLENDLILNRFLEENEESMTEDEANAFLSLMDLHDNDLMDLLLTRKELEGSLDVLHIRNLLNRIRAA